MYASADCSGLPIATGTAAQLASPGIAVTVGDATTAEFSVKATDLAPHTSDCSAPISYTEDSDIVAPSPPQLIGTDPGGGDDGPIVPGGGNGGPTPTAACIVPRLAGKTLAQAKAALAAAACKLGTMRQPRQRKGRRLSLVVKSSTPAPGASPANGRVHLTLGPKPRKAHR